ncbi:urease accessory protein [Hasllibacter halocynthiae]|uniref:Urease accessory protein UreE n=1 Tax=Hasllibacter halocynthiae TaxID=595589 RepID=A0A2T0X8Q3_9RHOB|nr:urease accessory protein UreE [Hasllibacter halocynthiae]PRY95313.1 urease accessory protein [Hasllibacter halocynthiae]
MTLPRAPAIAPPGPSDDAVSLDYEGRMLRRRRLAGRGGLAFVADLPETVSLSPGDRFALEDGRHVAVEAAPEALMVARAPDLARLAWHVGNRHTPCRIEPDRLVLRRDPVLADMLRRLGARLEEVEGPFEPEGGAYGMGRTLPHDHDHPQAHPHG